MEMKHYTTTISKKVNDFADTWTFYLRPVEGEDRPTFIPGQCAHLAAPGGEVEREFVRHMSVASLPDDEELVFSMDLSSNSPYKMRFRNAKVGDEVKLFKIKGHFTLENVPAGSKLVFIAGGIGITPIRSLIRQIRQGGLDLSWRLVYVGHGYLFREEFESCEADQKYIGRAQVAETLRELVAACEEAGSADTVFFISGSHSFVEDLSGQLMRKGVPESHIRTEDFK